MAHPASDAMVELSLRILPVERAMDVVARSNPAVEFAGRDAAGYILILSPFAEPAHAARLEDALTRINRARPDAVPVEVVERDDLRERLREDGGLRARGLAMALVRGSAERAFRDPNRHGSPDAPPLHRLHPSLPRVPLALLRELANRYRLARLIAFGSAVREDFRPDSDVDVMFEPRVGVQLGVAPRMEIQQRLEQALGRVVDLVNERAVTDTVRRRVGREGVVLYG
jgi:predicted nucleotidyltransferase